MNYPKLTVIILTREWNTILEDFLFSFPSWIEEVLIIEDSHKISQDSKKLPAHFPIRFLAQPLEKDFAAQRNWAFLNSQSDWTLFLDDDELVDEDFFTNLADILKKTPHEAVSIQRNQRFMGSELRCGDAGRQNIVRLARTKPEIHKWRGSVHETWQIQGKSVPSQLQVSHHNAVSVSDFLVKLHTYAQQDAAERGEISSTQLLVELLTFPVLKFLVNYLVKQGFKDGFPGFVHAWLMSYYSAIVRVYQYENTHH